MKKIASALLRLNDGSSKGKELMQNSLKQIPHLAKGAFSKLGISLEPNISTRVLVDLLLQKKKHVFVFDDLERRAHGENDNKIFGTINDLVENKGYKAIIVSNSLSNTADTQNSSIDGNVIEKLIWKIFEFSPKPADLAADVFGETEDNTIEFDMMAVISTAAETANCRNARAMLKAEDTIRDLFCLPCMHDKSFALESRKATLADAVKICFLVCMNRVPEKPKQPEQPDSTSGFSPEFFEFYSLEEEYEKFADLSFLSGALWSSITTKNELDAKIRSYMETRYPDSPDTAELKSIVGLLNNVSLLEDSEIENVIPRFRELVEHENFSPTIVGNIAAFNIRIKEIGFDSLFDDEELLAHCKAVIDNDPESAIAQLQSYISFLGNGIDYDTLNSLHEYAENSFGKSMIEQGSQALDAKSDNCGNELAEAMNQILQRRTRLLLAIDPVIICDCFQRSNPRGQTEIRKFFRSLKGYLNSEKENIDSYTEWFNQIKCQLDSCENLGRLGEMRKGWFVSVLDELILLPTSW